MNDNGITTLEQVRRFLEGTEVVDFAIKDKKECYAWIQKTLVRFRYLELTKQDKGLITSYLVKVSGYSRQQTTRLVAQYRKTGRVRRRQRTVAEFKRKYTGGYPLARIARRAARYVKRADHEKAL